MLLRDVGPEYISKKGDFHQEFHILYKQTYLECLLLEQLELAAADIWRRIEGNDSVKSGPGSSAFQWPGVFF